MRFDVITIGSATIDVYVKTDAPTKQIQGKEMYLYPSGAKIAIDDLQFRIGGGGVNTAAAFCRLGFRTGYIGAIGSDENARLILKELDAWKITFLGQRAKGTSGYSIILDSKGHDRTILTHKGASNDLRWDKRFEKLDTRLLFCGTMMGKSFETLNEMMRYNTHVPIIMNMSSYLAKKGMKAFSPMLSYVHTLIFNKEEAYMLMGKKAPLAKIALSLHKKGVQKVVITDGKNGVYASDGISLYFAQARKIRVVETTGAGDAFGAAFAAGFLLKKDFLTCLEMGMDNAEAEIQDYGTKNNLLGRKEMEKALKKRHKIKKLFL